MAASSPYSELLWPPKSQLWTPWVYGTVGRSLEAEKGRKLISAHLQPWALTESSNTEYGAQKISAACFHIKPAGSHPTQTKILSNLGRHYSYLLQHCSTQVYTASAGTPMLGNDKAWPLCCPESRPEVWNRDIHKCTSGKPKSSVWFLFQEELCYSALRLIPKWPKCISESINLIMNYPLGMWQGQFNTLSLLTV